MTQNQILLNNDEWTSGVKDITGKTIDTLSGIIAYQFSTQENITNSSEGWNNIENTITETTQTAQVNDGKVYFFVMNVATNRPNGPASVLPAVPGTRSWKRR